MTNGQSFAEERLRRHMPPLVSILIPCYNAAPWLRETLESALGQSWPNKEIIVVDDGSTDESPTILRAYAGRGIRVFTQANGGQSAAFNRAVAEARGEYFEFLDADDLIAPNKIAVQMARLASEAPDVMASGRWGRFHSNIVDADFRPDNLWADLDPVEWLVRAWSAHNMMHGAAYLVPASIVRRAGGWREELNLINDFEFFSRIMLHTRRIVFCAEANSYYRSGLTGSLSGTTSRRGWASAFRSLDLGTARLLEREDSPRTRHACAVMWRAFIHDAYPKAPELENQAAKRVQALGEDVGPPQWGPRFNAISALVGWRMAKRIQLAMHRIGSR